MADEPTDPGCVARDLADSAAARAAAADSELTGLDAAERRVFLELARAVEAARAGL